MADFEEFRKTERYKLAGKATRLQAAFYFFDPNKKGLTESRLKEVTKDDMTPDEFREGLGFCLRKHEVRCYPTGAESVYKIKPSVRKAIETYIEGFR